MCGTDKVETVKSCHSEASDQVWPGNLRLTIRRSFVEFILNAVEGLRVTRRRSDIVEWPQVAKASAEKGQATIELAIALPLLIVFLLGAWLTTSLLYKESVFAHASMSSARLGVSSSEGDVAAFLSRAMSETFGNPADVSVSYVPAAASKQGNPFALPAELEAMFDRATWVDSRYSPGGFILSGVGRWQPTFRQRLMIDRSDYEARTKSGKMVMDRTYALITAGVLAGSEKTSVNH